MTPEKRAELEKKLAAHGLTVLLIHDYDAILLQLARLAQFERLVVNAASLYPSLRGVITYIREQQTAAPAMPERCERRPLEVMDFPEILCQANRSLHERLDRGADLSPERLHAACAAFTSILCAQPSGR